MHTEQDLTPLLDTQQNQLSVVISEGSSLDAKILAIAATNVALLVFVAQASLSIHHQWQYFALLGPFFASLICNGIGLMPKNYFGASIDLNKHPEYLSNNNAQLVLQLISDTKSAITKNGIINARYWRYCAVSIALTVLGAVVLFAILES